MTYMLVGLGQSSFLKTYDKSVPGYTVECTDRNCSKHQHVLYMMTVKVFSFIFIITHKYNFPSPSVGKSY